MTTTNASMTISTDDKTTSPQTSANPGSGKAVAYRDIKDTSKGVYDQLADYTLIARYAGHNDKEQRRETWSEQIDRVFKMHSLQYYTQLESNPELKTVLQWTKQMILEKKVLGSQRALQFGGPSMISKHGRGYNCSATQIDRPRVFQEILFALLMGVGMGFSVQFHHIAKLPEVHPVDPDNKTTFIVPDSIEGWADAIGCLMSTYFRRGTAQEFMIPQNTNFYSQFSEGDVNYYQSTVEFDYSQVRPKGSPISHIGGKAPGPDGLRVSIEKIRAILEIASSQPTNRLTPIQAYDIVMHVSDAVLSGGVRRSATICLFSLEDTEMIKCKTGNWFVDNPQRGRSNNSALLLRNSTPKTEFMTMMESVKSHGEPGLVWAESLETLYNPCCEIALFAYDSMGRSGIQFCVAGDTELMTRNGSVEIGYAADSNSTLDIWNGIKWSSVSPVLTGKNKTLYRVKFSDGSHLDCTGNHRFSTKIGEGGEYADLTTEEILEASQDTNLKFYLPRPNVHPDTITTIRTGDVQNLGLSIGNPTTRPKAQLNMLQAMLSEHPEGRSAFLDGWKENYGSDNAAITSYISVAQAIQRLYTSMGECSEIISHEDGTYAVVLMGDEYQQHITAIIELLGDHDTYCLEEKDRHMCLFNNVMTRQCNLSEINARSVTNKADFLERCKAASVIGTIQAGYTNFDYLGSVTKSIVEREALIGVSMTGIMDSPDIILNAETLLEGAEVVKATNQKIAKWLGINPAARTTCVKPAGSTSCILKTASGVHPSHAKRYLRRVQSNTEEGPLNFFKSINPQAVEKSVWSAGGTDEVITFLCKAPPGAITKKDLTAIEFLDKVKLVQQNWVVPGTNPELCVSPGMCHNTSNTISVGDDEWDGVAEYIYENRYYFAGISMLPRSGDMIYQQAPFQEVLTHVEIAEKYGAGAVFASGLIVHAKSAFCGNLYNACSAAVGKGAALKPISFLTAEGADSTLDSLSATDVLFKKHRWVAQAIKFAIRHFDGDIINMTYCLKAVDAWKTWCDLKRTYSPVDWTEFKEETNNTKPTSYSACSGNKCEVIRF